jgi:signal transduction histidine kinase
MLPLIRVTLRDAAQLINMRATRSALTYGYLTLLALCTAAANFLFRQDSETRTDDLIRVLYLVVALVLLTSVSVRIERGHLTLSAIAIGTAAVLLNPLDATIVGLSLSIPMAGRGRWPILGNSIMAASYLCLAAIVAAQLRTGDTLGFFPRLFVIAAVNLGSWIFVGLGLSIRTGESVRSIVTHNFTAAFYVAYGYFALASLVSSYLLDGSLLGYLLTTIVFVLSLALTDTIAGRRVRRVLETELSDADRHLFHSRAVEGVVHNVRNHIATAVGYLKEVDLSRLDPIDREAVETATAAATDAVTVLRTLSQGATPRVRFAREPIDLNELVALAFGMARPRARSKEVELALRESPEDVNVKADPLLLREVVTNLVNNAIDAAPNKGKVDVTIGKRGASPYFSVGDNGPGVSDENRHHLFEPHFTTKETGTGLGLFMSYGVVREHQGDILYTGSSRGAVFTVVLPSFAS